ncbi:hypothetical protein AWQ21_14665 (plasmid) [Picosynechococcus sp. PCC 7003]|uniref:DEAD/DEAH box helicase n=1 Tax=Picosynechococcus sp. PCC 7003 TaxID=374981 RepID=UPI0008105A9E|nr:AAA domain-containing protein [Picosynechococcus sp. PCC 7003]ANV85774.1 hypothetical protein AWQ21_14665 [Picosynechococcus sp. PCC 7003]
MQKVNGQYFYSPSDLTRFMESPFTAWLDRFSLEYPERSPAKDPEDPLMGILREKGYAVEAALEKEFRQQGLTIVKIEGQSLAEKQTHTRKAIAAIVADYEQGQLPETSPAIVDFLTRAKPRFTPEYSGPEQTKAIAPSRDPQERLKQVINAVRHLDCSYLTIQGPPGAGKSYTGKHIIAELVKTGARIGITSNSHKAINNLLLSTAQHCHAQGIKATFTCAKIPEQEAARFADYNVTQITNTQLINHVQPSCVLGTTAWGFSRAEMADQLDYLFIDEAGQVSVANLVAMGRSAKNLVLMGDQMQLGQPSQASHPADSGLSCLDYLLGDQATIQADQGVFLGMTYRMHPHINHVISEHIYDGELDAHQHNDQRRLSLVANDDIDISQKEAGIIFVPVEHQGNSQASPEKVATIQSLVQSLLGRTFYTGQSEQPQRPIDWDDMLFVAPYNHQVQKLSQALGDRHSLRACGNFSPGPRHSPGNLSRSSLGANRYH